MTAGTGLWYDIVMIDLSPTQKKTVAAGLTVLSFTMVLAFTLFVGWVVLKFLSS